MVKRYGYHHVALSVRNLDTSIAFYEALGCTLVRVWGEGDKRNCMIDVGGNNILEIFSGDAGTPESAPKFKHIALRSEDPDADYAAALAAGARERNTPADANIGGNYPVRIAFVFGPDDEVIEFFKEL